MLLYRIHSPISILMIIKIESSSPLHGGAFVGLVVSLSHLLNVFRTKLLLAAAVPAIIPAGSLVLQLVESADEFGFLLHINTE